MAGLKNSCNGFAYAIDFKDGGYVLNITNAAAILARNEMTGKIEFDLNRCPPLCDSVPTFLTRKLMSPSPSRMAGIMARNLRS